MVAERRKSARAGSPRPAGVFSEPKGAAVEAIADRIIPVLQDKWAEVLSIPPGARQVNLAYEEVRPRVEAAFPASGPFL